MIEGNQLNPEAILKVIQLGEYCPRKERNERKVKGYYAVLAQLEQYAAQGVTVTEKIIQILHALVMSDGSTRAKPKPYRDGQHAIQQ